MHGGFNSKKLEQEYISVVNKMTILLIDQLSLQLQLSKIDQITNKQFFDKQFTKLLNSIKSLENQKRLPPKFSNLLQPLQFVIQNKANQMTSNEQVTNAKPKYIPPILEQDVQYSTQFTKRYSNTQRQIQYINQTQKKKNFSPNKINRVCKYLDQKKTRPMNYNIGEFYADFQNDSQIVGKNKLLDYKLQSSELNKIAKTSLSVDTSQLQEISRFSNFHEQY
ncbi:unnamed protein product (macronuclear) [Paramecium tetraurelia]|uniref:Uncharacterized protein n=1 Tax=Paramecium tetraurelia TaxID=5888 RepID=A0CM09_PARTE|nr:uncharacterized protein GSPATT00008305001 [Paramecium tetraurelia]CAK71826.1 unnamed protein product [Paramecium tetraurelia]|eukprot:XP_001439223.1 hypothetical protein (macronuclear) [Paramecium tetraurelia strain d4-2]